MLKLHFGFWKLGYMALFYLNNWFKIFIFNFICFYLFIFTLEMVLVQKFFCECFDFEFMVCMGFNFFTAEIILTTHIKTK